MAQASKAAKKDLKQKSPARHHQHHHGNNHASIPTSISVVNFASVINSDITTKGLTTKAVQSGISKKYDHLHYGSIDKLTCNRKEDSDAQHHHDHNTSTTASTTNSTVRGINLPRGAHKNKNLLDCHHHAWGQQRCEHHHYDSALAIACTSNSTASRSTIRGDQSSTSEEVVLDPGSQDEQLESVGSWMEEYDDKYDGNHPQEVDSSDTEEPKKRERDG
ncbi:hypothetical protein BGAL_0421g00100 [Botrytis galanthina]|uniref:Uncharacterized protein n=1 Tax=Botrytis galanthina TaxID=278940 RepID=A0A4S8QQK1_9HELO|nr:hypothetical protein BGAL_0421g00100 [Botrytis galanthina]